MNVIGKLYIFVRNTFRKRKLSQQEIYEHQFLSMLESNEVKTPEELLQDCLNFAVENIPFYREFAKGRSADSIPIEQWPILTKEIIRCHISDLTDPNISNRKHWKHASGGSTGKPVYVIHDEEFAGKAEALRKFFAKVIYGGPYYNQLILWGNPNESKENESSLKSRILSLIGLTTSHFNTFNWSDQKMRECIATLKSQKPDFIAGYAGSIYDLAKYIEENGIDLRKKPKAVLLTAQTCYPFMHDKIQETFRSQVCNHYGSREIGPAGWEAPDGKIYLANFFHKIEILDDNNEPVPTGTEGRVLVTTLHNYAMPLIRYDIGDRAIMGEPVSVRGYTLPTFEKIIGKTSEVFTTRSGCTIHGQYFINLFYFRDWVDEFQVVQEDFERVVINYTTRAIIKNADKIDIEYKIREALGGDCVIIWSELTVIPKTSAGKHLYVKSLVNKNK